MCTCYIISNIFVHLPIVLRRSSNFPSSFSNLYVPTNSAIFVDLKLNLTTRVKFVFFSLQIQPAIGLIGYSALAFAFKFIIANQILDFPIS